MTFCFVSFCVIFLFSDMLTFSCLVKKHHIEKKIQVDVKTYIISIRLFTSRVRTFCIQWQLCCRILRLKFCKVGGYSERHARCYDVLATPVLISDIDQHATRVSSPAAARRRRRGLRVSWSDCGGGQDRNQRNATRAIKAESHDYSRDCFGCRGRANEVVLWAKERRRWV